MPSYVSYDSLFLPYTLGWHDASARHSICSEWQSHRRPERAVIPRNTTPLSPHSLGHSPCRVHTCCHGQHPGVCGYVCPVLAHTQPSLRHLSLPSNRVDSLKHNNEISRYGLRPELLAPIHKRNTTECVGVCIKHACRV